MSGCYLATNLITDDCVLTPSTEDENYPVENIYDQIAGNRFKTESAVLLSIEFDFLAAIAIDTFAIINHNFSQAAVITLKSGAASPPADTVAVLTWREFDIWKTFASQSKRYWSITVTDSIADVLAVGQILFGNKINLPRARRISDGYKPSRSRTVVGGETYAGVEHSFYLYDRLTFNPSFRIAGESERDIFDAMDRALYGNVFPFLYVPDESGENCFYVRKGPDFQTDEVDKSGSGIVYDLTLDLKEESRGLAILE